MRAILRGLKTPVVLVLLLAFVGYGAQWGFTHATAPVPGRPVEPCVMTDVGGKLTPDKVQVRVLNGGTRSGLAKKTALSLRIPGFHVIRVNNTDERITETVIVGSAVTDPEVQLLLAYFPKATARADGRADHVVDVLLGDRSSSITDPEVLSIDVPGPVCLPALTTATATESASPSASATPETSPSPEPTATKKASKKK